MKNKIKTIGLVGILSILILSGTAKSASASPFCTSQRCKEAAAAEKEAMEKANANAAAAQTLQGEVERLSDEISAIEAKIKTNQATADDLATAIRENEVKLAAQQTALANLIVDMHFDGQPDAIMILATSSSISDYAEKQARLDTAKTQVSISAQAVKSLKEELIQQKAEVDRIIIDQKNQQAAVENKRAEQSDLVAKYQGNAAAFAADAEAARQIKLAEMEANRQAITGVIGGNRYASGNDTYIYRGFCLDGGGPYFSNVGIYGGYRCQCVDYTGWKVYEYTKGRIHVASDRNGYGWGNANTWDYYADLSDYNIWVDYNPAPNTVAVSHAGDFGHVMWVEAVNGDGTIQISEYNWVPFTFTTSPNVPTAGLLFIHFDNYAY